MNSLYWIDSTLHSYSQIFFSKNKILALLTMAVCFMHPLTGLVSLLFVLGINLLAHVIGFSKELIRDGYYGFNAVLLGASLTQLYHFNTPFVIICVTSVFLLLLNTVWTGVMLEKYKAPILSIPFLLTFWIVSLGIRGLDEFQPNEDSLFIINHAESMAGSWWYQAVHCLDNLHWPQFLVVYFKTLGSVFFQPNILAGVLLSLGLLYFSRIAFTLSLIGLGAAYLFYSALGIDVTDLNENLAGANYIFLAIALGCFYVIANKWTYLLVLVLTPILMLMYLFFGKIMFIFQLQSFTLSFSVCTILALFLLNHRLFQKWIKTIAIQYYAPEKTIYKHVSSLNRFKFQHLFKFQLPFWGEWKVSQGHNGGITHLGDWKFALDFVIENERADTYNLPGTSREDFYCYNKPVLAVGDGYVYDLDNSIGDNEIGGVNLENNWGNSIVINHLNGLFTQISHIKKDSFKVAIGDYVTKGTPLALVGNSGRSPEPHIHFQVQLDPKIGGKTYDYPMAYFLEKHGKNHVLKHFEVPQEGSIIQSIEKSELLVQVFQFIPGYKLTFKSETGSESTWEVFTDAWNNSYLYCHLSKSLAYFVNDGTMFYFFDFEGSKKSLLFQFYLACNRVLLGAYEGVSIKDSIPLHYFNNFAVKFVQDFFAPFYLFTEISYQSEYSFIDDPNHPTRITLTSEINSTFFKRKRKNSSYTLELKDNKIVSFTTQVNHLKNTYTCD